MLYRAESDSDALCYAGQRDCRRDERHSFFRSLYRRCAESDSD